MLLTNFTYDGQERYVPVTVFYSFGDSFASNILKIRGANTIPRSMPEVSVARLLMVARYSGTVNYDFCCGKML